MEEALNTVEPWVDILWIWIYKLPFLLHVAIVDRLSYLSGAEAILEPPYLPVLHDVKDHIAQRL
jgi:hypothetical protein